MKKVSLKPFDIRMKVRKTGLRLKPQILDVAGSMERHLYQINLEGRVQPDRVDAMNLMVQMLSEARQNQRRVTRNMDPLEFINADLNLNSSINDPGPLDLNSVPEPISSINQNILNSVGSQGRITTMGPGYIDASFVPDIALSVNHTTPEPEDQTSIKIQHALRTYEDAAITARTKSQDKKSRAKATLSEQTKASELLRRFFKVK